MTTPGAGPGTAGPSPSRRGRLPRWLRLVLSLALAVGAVAVMVRLSIWQWDRGRARGSLLNYTYAVEWLLFAVLTVAGLVRLAREGGSPADQAPTAPDPGEPTPAPARSAHAPVVGPPLLPGEEIAEVTWVRLRRRIGLDGR